MHTTSRARLLVAVLALSLLWACTTPVANVGTTLQVKRGDAFWLNLGVDHQPYLAVITPDDQSRIIVDDCVVGAPIRQTDFLAMSRLLVDTSKMYGITYDDDGRAQRLPVFDASGNYHFVISNNLETELENMDGFNIFVNVE